MWGGGRVDGGVLGMVVVVDRAMVVLFMCVCAWSGGSLGIDGGGGCGGWGNDGVAVTVEVGCAVMVAVGCVFMVVVDGAEWWW